MKPFLRIIATWLRMSEYPSTRRGPGKFRSQSEFIFSHSWTRWESCTQVKSPPSHLCLLLHKTSPQPPALTLELLRARVAYVAPGSKDHDHDYQH